jgi:isopenicillin-N N-acyltransferase-like protein
LLLTVQGGVGLAGVNEAGLSIVVNKVRAEDAAPGIVSPFLLRNALQHGSLETAVQALVTAPRMAGGNYLVSDIWGRTINVELSAKKTSLTLLETRPFVHANHYLSEKLGDVQQEMRPAERAVSVARQRRMQTLLTAHQQGMDGEALLHILADHREEVPGGSICRHGEGQALRTCVSVIISPHQRIMWIGAGYPCKTEYLGLQL